MTQEELKAEVEKLWRPCSGPEFPEPFADVLIRLPFKAGYVYDVFMWDGCHWAASGDRWRPDQMAEKDYWRPIL